MSSLSKKEMVGFLSLAIVVAAILAAGFIARDCRGSSDDNRAVPPVIVSDSDAGEADYDNDSFAGKTYRKKSGRRSSARSRKSSSARTAKEKEPTLQYDPFSDTIPLDLDEIED